ncbi:hypothetical protein EDB84DRAFT_1447797, partial [Lactarius hengduanensis]
MLTMTYAHARASGNSSLISRYYDLLICWADYSTLNDHPHMYSADGRTTDNQTNLAIKGIIAIKAMSQMSSFVDKYSICADLLDVAMHHRVYTQWKSLALTDDKPLLGAYGNMSSWTLGYNLFADVWLNTSLVGSSV